MPLTSTSTSSFTILPHMCPEQKELMRSLTEAADDIGAAATSMVTQGGQGYNALLAAQNHFHSLLLTIMQKTRICISE